jgi:DNA-binding transcriptional ArsR family regulator
MQGYSGTTTNKRQEPDTALCEYVADYFRLLAEPLRLKILNVLRSGPRNVNAITQAIDAHKANVSKHLSQLLAAGLVNRRQAGNSAIYSISDPGIFNLCDFACSQMAQKLEKELVQDHFLLEHLST